MNILIIDDEDLVRKSLGRAFKAKGHVVYLAEGGISGLKLWRDNSVDIVLLDILMPDLSGPKVLENKPSDCFVLLMSAFKGEYDSISAIQLGANGFIAKPFEDIFQIVEKIERSYYEYLENKESRN
ncbi:MAG: response regulator [Bdellovibrionaceae bacterium]|nr:response regulator [Pseudobdellovibrionaceae bacterium]